ncbi:DUF1430 domain-containing protein [Streptococcus suis]|uniref:DUF1430 domain-containing protein n=1 Tax=Streptococcus suivaginalis TaxID=3028082 RepID=A0AA96ZYK7_9STRE|nr:DUF1430 domain-containing protein [Streptococcus sp. 29896]MCK4027277.1 DUF1430 domain-containing protein [Streptococcus suis]WNY46623.1 DUF1430 domain-containing protein [Streptococcus sp. 29896]
MKRLFIILSNILVACFLSWVVSIWADTYVSFYYPKVVVLDMEQRANFSSLAESLQELADETDSLIAMQHEEVGGEGTTEISYVLFGKGSLPEGIREKEKKDLVNPSIVTNYFIFGGSLRLSQLQEKLAAIGLSHMHLMQPSSLDVLVWIFGNGFQLIALLIFFLTFGALVLIGHIGRLRASGIRLISGESRWSIFLRPMREDGRDLLFGWLIGSSSAILFFYLFGLPKLAILTLVGGLAIYGALLFLIALFFASVFSIALQRVHLMQLIKGRFPVKGVMGLLFFGQMLALLIVSLGVSRTFLYSQTWSLHHAGQTMWQQEKDLVSLGFNRSSFSHDKDERNQIQSKWLQLAEKAVSDQKGLLSRHFLVDYWVNTGGNIWQQAPLLDWQDYSPQGNVLLVTPLYLERQGIELTPALKESLAKLNSSGKFILLVPDKLREKEQNLISEFEEALTDMVYMQDSSQKMKAMLHYIDSNQLRFTYNTTPLSYQQFVRDPILVVLTPQSTGDQAIDFWSNQLQTYFYFEDLAYLQDLVTTHGLDYQISEMPSGNQIFQDFANKLQREVWFMMASAGLGILTSLLLFNTMNLLYFEEFRREIFIKRLAGLTFFEQHRSYFLAQFCVLLLGAVGGLFFTKHVFLSLAVFALFLANTSLLLYRQSRKEEKSLSTILKGA